MSSQGASSSLLPAATPGDFLVEGKLKLRLRGNTSISRANIHSIDNSTRLLIPQENSKHNLLFQDEELTGTEVVTKAAKSLISYITNPPGLNFNCRIPFPVNLTYRRLLSEGNDLSKNADFVYLALVHKELREKFPVSPKELLGVFTDWMAQWPSVSDVLDMDRDRKNLLESRRKKLRKIPRFEKSEELLGKVLGVLEVINSLGWDDEFVLPNVVLRKGSDVPQGLPTEYMTGVFRVKNLLENRDVVRMLARICRVTEKSASSPVREHLRRTLDMVIACGELQLDLGSFVPPPNHLHEQRAHQLGITTQEGAKLCYVAFLVLPIGFSNVHTWKMGVNLLHHRFFVMSAPVRRATSEIFF